VDYADDFDHIIMDTKKQQKSLETSNWQDSESHEFDLIAFVGRAKLWKIHQTLD
jgi:hypothetical protein